MHRLPGLHSSHVPQPQVTVSLIKNTDWEFVDKAKLSFSDRPICLHQHTNQLTKHCCALLSLYYPLTHPSWLAMWRAPRNPSSWQATMALFIDHSSSASKDTGIHWPSLHISSRPVKVEFSPVSLVVPVSLLGHDPRYNQPQNYMIWLFLYKRYWLSFFFFFFFF